MFSEKNTYLCSGSLMIYDICVPALNIIFEYHGHHHYHDHYLFGDVNSCKERDKKRRLACANQSINYLEVPYWWQRDQESLIAMVHQVRPDVVPYAPIGIPFQYEVKAKPSKALFISQIKLY